MQFALQSLSPRKLELPRGEEMRSTVSRGKESWAALDRRGVRRFLRVSDSSYEYALVRL